MMKFERIRNNYELSTCGNEKGRKVVLEILEAALQAADPYLNVRNLVQLTNNELSIGNKEYEPIGAPYSGKLVYDLSKIDNVFVFGAGKGCQRVAKALEDILGTWLTGGHVISKKGEKKILTKIGVTFGGHPLPDYDSLKGSNFIIEKSKLIGKDDLVFTIVTNGVSSLLTKPVPNVSIEDLRKLVYELQISHGVSTIELNSVRNHLDVMKGGRISKLFHPAKMIHIFCDDPMEYDRLMQRNYWLATLPDSTTFQDAINILKKWNVWRCVSPSIKEHLLEADPKYETLKSRDFLGMDFRVYGIMPNKTGMVETAKRKAKELGYKSLTLCQKLQAEASQAGNIIASIALTIDKIKEPVEPPCVILTNGELLVTVGNKDGVGGRNQEYVLSAAEKIAGNKNIVIGAVDSDGSDGPGNQFKKKIVKEPTFAGGLVDGYTLKNIKEVGWNLHEALENHNSTPLLRAIKSGIILTPNISLDDISVILIDSG